MVYVLLILALDKNNNLQNGLEVFESAKTCIQAQEDTRKELAPKFEQVKVMCVERKVIK